jgi:hypothetical protein
VAQVGGESRGRATSTDLQLTFKSEIEGLTAQDITLGGPVSKGDLSGSGKVWIIALNEVTAAGEATVAIEKAGIISAVKKTKVYLEGDATDGPAVEDGTGDDNEADDETETEDDNEADIYANTSNGGYFYTNYTPDLKQRFGITTTGAQGVADTLFALHNLISAPKEGDHVATVIRLGDWIDLPYLHVVGYPNADDEGSGKIDIPTNIPLERHGSILRLIVVGINSFNGYNSYSGNGNDTPHVVFQFQNIPGYHAINSTGYPGGYLRSGLRTYIKGNFLSGLKAAGVPNSVLWAPSRRTGNNDEGPTSIDTIIDKLWLPTATEVIGQPYGKHETASNQATLDYYLLDYIPNLTPNPMTNTPPETIRNKYNASNGLGIYWAASLSYAYDKFGVWDAGANFVFFYRYPNAAPFEEAKGIAPAFCVK